MSLYSLYIHIPFCRRRCGYCDFNTYAGQGDRIPAYVEALTREMTLVAQSAGSRLPVHTVYFGGGTPSLLSTGHVTQLLNIARQVFDIQNDAEITLEANPGTVDLEKLLGFREAGVNRISLGMQSAQPDDLHLLDRQHDPQDVVQAVKWARQAGFDNLSLDLIFGIPRQTLESWKYSLESALNLAPEHLSLYSLTVEHGTPLARWVGRGLLPLPDDDLAADQYEWAMERLDQAGFVQYEISNWAARNSAGEALISRHNLQYWLGEPYLGLGAGAHGYASGWRTANSLRIAIYNQKMMSGNTEKFPFSPANVHRVKIEPHTAMQERMMVGLRLTQDGVAAADFYNSFGVQLQDVFGNEIDALVGQGLLEWIGEDDPRLRLTQHGRLLGNRVFMAFVD